uniref:Uncharacterized protein n=1 Tax=Tanacetum cinerariifolium TaxID=118510 RepID=A0A699KUJ3_TANCI|nr:hypothetical protein [Tanacetum cinerariifolium]
MRRIKEEARRLAVIREFVFFSSVANDVTGTDCNILVASLLDPNPRQFPGRAMMPPREHASRHSSTKSRSKEEAINESSKIDILKTNWVHKTQWKSSPGSNTFFPAMKPPPQHASSKETEIKICGAEGDTTSFVGVHSKMSIQAERHSRKLVRCRRRLIKGSGDLATSRVIRRVIDIQNLE